MMSAGWHHRIPAQGLLSSAASSVRATLWYSAFELDTDTTVMSTRSSALGGGAEDQPEELPCAAELTGPGNADALHGVRVSGSQ